MGMLPGLSVKRLRVRAFSCHAWLLPSTKKKKKKNDLRKGYWHWRWPKDPRLEEEQGAMARSPWEFYRDRLERPRCQGFGVKVTSVKCVSDPSGVSNFIKILPGISEDSKVLWFQQRHPKELMPASQRTTLSLGPYLPPCLKQDHLAFY